MEPEDWKSTDVTALGREAFIASVINALPGKRMLTAAEIDELRREHTQTIEPARQSRREAFVLERKLSDLVNDAYGLTPEEEQLIWSTAPPRMPFTPAGLTSETKSVSSDDQIEETA
jgi:hypothetical protein